MQSLGRLEGIDQIKMIKIGRSHICASNKFNNVLCFGSNRYEQTTVPEKATDIQQMDVSFDSTATTNMNGDLVVWGKMYEK